MEQRKAALTPDEYIVRTAYNLRNAKRAQQVADKKVRDAEQAHIKALEIGEKKEGENRGSSVQSR